MTSLPCSWAMSGCCARSCRSPRSHWRSSYSPRQLLDGLSRRSFVFIDILGSLVDFSSAVAQRWAHFALLCGLSSRRVFGGRPPLLPCCAGGDEERNRISNILSLSFVFIDILALFARKPVSTIRFHLKPRHSRMAQTSLCGSAMSRRDRSGRAAQFDCPVRSSGRTPGFSL